MFLSNFGHSYATRRGWWNYVGMSRMLQKMENDIEICRIWCPILRKLEIIPWNLKFSETETRICYSTHSFNPRRGAYPRAPSARCSSRGRSWWAASRWRPGGRSSWPTRRRCRRRWASSRAGSPAPRWGCRRKAAPRRRFPRPRSPRRSPRYLSWKVRSARDRTIRTFLIGVRSEFLESKFFQNSGIFARKFKNLGNFGTFSKTSAKFRQNLIQIWAKINEKNF